MLELQRVLRHKVSRGESADNFYLELVEIPMQVSVLEFFSAFCQYSDDSKRRWEPTVIYSSSTVVQLNSFLCYLVEIWI